MSILIGKYEFDGPFNSLSYLQEKRGLYAVLKCEGTNYELIHVAQADNVREQIELSQSAYSDVKGEVRIAACYTPRSGLRERSKMIDEINREFDAPDEQECDQELLAKAAC